MPVEDVQAYYDADDVGAAYGLPGAGIVGLMSGDFLAPPMIDRPDLWADARRWPEAAQAAARALASMAELKPGMRVLDVGSGVGGPARLLVREYGVHVVCANISKVQLATSQRINQEQGLTGQIETIYADAQALPFEDSSFDAVYSLNMLYHVPHKRQALNEFERVLKPTGSLAIEDWFVTDTTPPAVHDKLRFAWQNDDFWTYPELREHLHSLGMHITQDENLSFVGRELMHRYFRTGFEAHIVPQLKALYPQWGEQMGQDLLHDIEETIAMYRAGHFAYHRLAALKADGA